MSPRYATLPTPPRLVSNKKEGQKVRNEDEESKRRKAYNGLAGRLEAESDKKDAAMNCLNITTSLLSERSLSKDDRSYVSLEHAPPIRLKDESSFRTLLDYTKREATSILNILDVSIRSHPRTVLPPSKSEEFLYRLQCDHNGTSHYKDLGLVSVQLHRLCGLKGATAKDFEMHMEGVMFPTKYISTTESPGRLIKLAIRGCCTPPQWRVLLIDIRGLHQMGIPTKRTTELAKEFGTYPKYITSTHWLIQYWIPSSCIILDMSYSVFLTVCKEQGICDGARV